MRLDRGIFLLLACAATSCSGEVSPAFFSPMLRATVESVSSLHHVHPAMGARHRPRAMLATVFCQEGVPINEALTSVGRSFSNGLPGMNLPKVIHSATKSVSLSKRIELFAEEGNYSVSEEEYKRCPILKTSLECALGTAYLANVPPPNTLTANPPCCSPGRRNGPL